METLSLLERLEDLTTSFSGILGLWFKSLESGQEIAVHAEETFETASTIKLLLLETTLHQVDLNQTNLDTQLTMLDKHHVGGSGVLKDLSYGLKLSLRDTLTLMIIVSDNVATNMIVDFLGPETIDQEAKRLGLTGTQLFGPINLKGGPDRKVGITTPYEMGYLLEGMVTGRLLQSNTTAIALDILGRQQFTNATARYLPYKDLTGAGPDEEPNIHIYSKSGSWDGVRNDVAYFQTPKGDYILSLFTKGCTDPRYHVDNEALLFLPKVAHLIYEAMPITL